MNCCADVEPPSTSMLPLGIERSCLSCKDVGRSVSVRTMLLMLKPEFFDLVGESQFRFCTSSACRVVYFSRERSFATEDLRVRVGIKEKDGPVPLCYCFGFDERAVRAEIEAEGKTTIPQRITALIKDRMCACEERNPSGGCCLGEVAKAVKRLMKGAV